MNIRTQKHHRFYGKFRIQKIVVHDDKVLRSFRFHHLEAHFFNINALTLLFDIFCVKETRGAFRHYECIIIFRDKSKSRGMVSCQSFCESFRTLQFINFFLKQFKWNAFPLAFITIRWCCALTKSTKVHLEKI